MHGFENRSRSSKTGAGLLLTSAPTPDCSNLLRNVAINLIDILLAIVILLSVLNGYRRGFVPGVLDLTGWVLSLLAGLRYSQPLAAWLGPRVDLWSEVWDQPIAFVLIAVFVGVLVHAI